MASACCGSIWKPSSREPSTTSVPVIREMCECRAYVGSNTSARRLGPPKASMRHCRTSLDPLAQKTSSGDTPCRSATAWHSSVAGRSGYRLKETSSKAASSSSRQASGGPKGDSLVLRRTSASTWGEW